MDYSYIYILIIDRGLRENELLFYIFFEFNITTSLHTYYHYTYIQFVLQQKCFIINKYPIEILLQLSFIGPVI